jgi:hypothetical protein
LALRAPTGKNTVLLQGNICFSSLQNGLCEPPIGYVCSYICIRSSCSGVNRRIIYFMKSSVLFAR